MFLPFYLNPELQACAAIAGLCGARDQTHCLGLTRLTLDQLSLIPALEHGLSYMADTHVQQSRHFLPHAQQTPADPAILALHNSLKRNANIYHVDCDVWLF